MASTGSRRRQVRLAVLKYILWFLLRMFSAGDQSAIVVLVFSSWGTVPSASSVLVRSLIPTHSLSFSRSLSLYGHLRFGVLGRSNLLARHPWYHVVMRKRTPYVHRFSMVALPKSQASQAKVHLESSDGCTVGPASPARLASMPSGRRCGAHPRVACRRVPGRTTRQSAQGMSRPAVPALSSQIAT